MADDDYIDDVEYVYVIRLSIRHPEMDPAEITQTLQLTPKIAWKAGQRARDPKGRLRKGFRHDTRWGYSEHYVGQSPRFFERVAELISLIEPHACLFENITKSGGSCSIILHLPGALNIGDELSPRLLCKMGNMNLGLGIEVFPHWRGLN